MWSVLTILLLTFSPLYAQTLTLTNGTSGEPCPVRKCLADRAMCVNNMCECLPPFQLDLNNGHFACYRSNQVFAEVKNDPTVKNFNNETATFQYPCRYLLASAVTNLRIDKQNRGTCRCVIHTFNQKYKGKIIVGGFDFACLIINTVLNEQLGFSVRMYGIAQNGHFTYTEHSVNSFLPDGPWNTNALFAQGAGITVQSSFDHANNQARVSLLECGWVVSLVAYDIVERRDQDQVPGLAIGINCGLDPFFLEHNRSIATAPPRFGGMTYKDLAIPPRTVPQMLLIRAFTSNVVQNQPGASEKCSTVGDFLDQCSNSNLKNRAARGCFWMLSEPRFIRCLDPGSDATPVLALLETCISYFCGFGATCYQFRSDVFSTKCEHVSGIPELGDIVSGDLCIS